MRVVGAFTVGEFTPVGEPLAIEVGLPVGHARMVKQLTGDIEGRSITQFSWVHDPDRGGTYVATESFAGSVAGRVGTFAFVHSATDDGSGARSQEFSLVVPGSGTGALSGIAGTATIEIDDDGSHRLVLDVTLD